MLYTYTGLITFLCNMLYPPRIQGLLRKGVSMQHGKHTTYYISNIKRILCGKVAMDVSYLYRDV